jgi:hypothetical protein
MAGPSDQSLIVDIFVAILGCFAPVGVVVVLLVVRDRRGRFSLFMLLVLTALVSLAVWAWATVLNHP